MPLATRPSPSLTELVRLLIKTKREIGKAGVRPIYEITTTTKRSWARKVEQDAGIADVRTIGVGDNQSTQVTAQLQAEFTIRSGGYIPAQVIDAAGNTWDVGYFRHIMSGRYVVLECSRQEDLVRTVT